MKIFLSLDWNDWGLPFGLDYHESISTSRGPLNCLVLKTGPVHLLIAKPIKPRRTS
jgi:hypothetical protein